MAPLIPLIGSTATGHRWSFFRSGGFDQVRLDTADDLLNLDQLDPKLWAALSCPTQGIEFPARTLELLDADKDARIRVPEVLAAVKWACALLKDPAELMKRAPALPLDAINIATPDGARMHAAARRILANLGKGESDSITPEDLSDEVKIFAATRWNGDGIVPAEAADDPATRTAIEEIIKCMGPEEDRGGLPGVSQAKVEAFYKEAADFSEWMREAEESPSRFRPLGAATAEAYAAFAKVAPKIDDYFTRCQLVAFDARSAVPLTPGDADYAALAPGTLSNDHAGLAGFPLSKPAAGQSLNLAEGINPAWAAAMESFMTLCVRVLLGPRTALSAAEWAGLKLRFAPHGEWLAKKKGAAVEALGVTRVREMIDSGVRRKVEALIAEDKALEGEANSVGDVERLVLYHRDLYHLLNNFVSLREFYTGNHIGIFQVGTLYIDGRSCDLCVRVNDMAKHSGLAHLSGTYLTYCECTRPGSKEKWIIAAAFTEGDSDNLMVGRNGIFYDRQGRDWDATIIKLIDHPISIRQAFWSPYKRMARMVAEQIEKFAASRDKAIGEQSSAGITHVAGKMEEAKPSAAPAPPAPFDIAKFAGIFAAIGLAVGTIGAAAASVVTGFLALKWWQMPLSGFGLLLAISGPSMLLAALKLRRRNLAPLLDAGGWAVNSQAKINLLFGSELTRLAKLPPGAERTMDDPYAEKKRPWKRWVAVAAALFVIGTLWQLGFLGPWLKQARDKVTHAGQKAKAADEKAAEAKDKGKEPKNAKAADPKKGEAEKEKAAAPATEVKATATPAPPTATPSPSPTPTPEPTEAKPEPTKKPSSEKEDSSSKASRPKGKK